MQGPWFSFITAGVLTGWGGNYALQLLWPHLGQWQWFFIGDKLMEINGIDPFLFTYAALPIAMVTMAEYLRRKLA
jgi:hypothetical protein